MNNQAAKAIEGWVNNGLLLYVHKEKSPAWATSNRLQLPSEVQSKQGQFKNIITNEDVVNPLLQDTPAGKRGQTNFLKDGEMRW
jgi:hypothetical protein